MDVDLDDAGVWGDLQELQARVARRRVAFQHQLDALLGRRGLHGLQQRQVVLQVRQRRHEHVQHATATAVLALGPRAVAALRVAHLHAQRGAGDAGGGLAALRRLGLHHAGDLVAQGHGRTQRRAGREGVDLGGRRMVLR
jgi:hypothetical protein